MDYIKLIVSAVLGGIIVLAGSAFFAPKGAEAPSFGAAANVTTVGNPWVFSNTSSGITFSGTITQSTSNTATTSFKGGCIQTTATSTATPIRLVIGSAQAATTTFQGSNANFTVLAQFGTCPA